MFFNLLVIFMFYTDTCYIMIDMKDTLMRTKVLNYTITTGSLSTWNVSFPYLHGLKKQKHHISVLISNRIGCLYRTNTDKSSPLLFSLCWTITNMCDCNVSLRY